MNRPLYWSTADTRTSTGLLLLRLVVGSAFILHGWGKIQNPFNWASWMGPDAPPSFLQFLAAISEFGGGILWILGLLTPLASFGILCTMLGALFFVHFPNGDVFVGQNGTYELPLVFLAVALLLLLAGPGRFSLDARLFGPDRTRASRERETHPGSVRV